MNPTVVLLESPVLAPRFIDCPACNGDREFEVWTGYDPRDGSATGYMDHCDYCNGTGEVEEDVTPITIADLDDMVSA